MKLCAKVFLMSKNSRLIRGVGIDMTDISRFERFNRNAKHHFLKRAFPAREIFCCFKFKKPAPHLAGFFAAKEAASKALGAARFPYIKLG